MAQIATWLLRCLISWSRRRRSRLCRCRRRSLLVTPRHLLRLSSPWHRTRLDKHYDRRCVSKKPITPIFDSCKMRKAILELRARHSSFKMNIVVAEFKHLVSLLHVEKIKTNASHRKKLHVFTSQFNACSIKQSYNFIYHCCRERFPC